MLAPPRPPAHDEREALIREARARQRKRLLGAAAAVALVAGAALGISSVLVGGSPSMSRSGGGPAQAVKTGNTCGVRGEGVRILDASGRTVYREPGHYTRPNAGRPEIRCSGSTIWAVFFNGVAASQEAYFGVRSVNAGRTWRAIFTERFFGMKAPHQLDDYMGPWTLTRHGAFFIGLCPACDPQPTISLWVTRDGGRTFKRVDVAALDGYGPTAIRVSRARVKITGERGNVPGPKHKTVTVHVA